jgi:hypothetical protein
MPTDCAEERKMCVCVCVCEEGEKGREMMQGERKRASARVCVF